MITLYDFSVKNARGEEISLADFRGKVVLIVNTATKCGLAGQFEELEALWQEYDREKFVILGFPCGQFADQEPETNDTMEAVCKLNFGVTFPLFAKIDVNGEREAPLYTFLKSEKPRDVSNHAFQDFLIKLASFGQKREGSDIQWNFTKFLIDQNGRVVERFAPTTKPQEMKEKIEQLLG